jgi:signal transduction histidine kinase
MIERPRPREPTPRLLRSFSDKLAELEVVLGRQSERFAGILDIAAALSSARELDALLQLVVERVTTLLRAEAATLFLLDETTDELWSKVLRGSALKELRLPSSKGIAGHVVRTGDLVSLGDAYADARFNPEVDRKSGFKTRSLIAAPLRHVSGRILGVLQVLHRQPDAFGPEDLHLVEAVAAQIAGVLDNVLLLEELKRQNAALTQTQGELSDAVRELDLLYEVEKAITSTESQQELLERILVKAMEVSGAAAAAVLLCEEEGQTLYFRSRRNGQGDGLASFPLAPGRGVVGHVALTGKRVRLADAERSPHLDKALTRKLGVTPKALLCVPIPGDQGVLGALELLNKRGGFVDADERLVTLLAGQTGRAILQRRAREQGERKARLAAVGQMLAGVLHDLRTPLTIASGYVQLLSIEPDPQERAKFAEIVGNQFEHIDSMTRETLAFARGERDLLIRKVYMQKFVQEVEAFLRKDLENGGVELKLQASYTGAARFDETKLKRVIYNIARNALQAMPDGGRFTFGVEKDEGELVFRFADTGPGVPEEIADSLFEEFVTAGKSDGTGLGLAIVKRITEEHGGTVSCRSRPGKGTTFEVRIPA